MKNDYFETAIMSDEAVSPFKKCMDNLLNTRDMGTYLDALMEMRNKYLLILSVQDTPGIRMPNDIFEKIHKLGFTNFLKDHLRTYIGVIDRGKIISDCHDEKEAIPIQYSVDIDGVSIFVKSEAYKKGRADIVIDGENYSLNSRGINIVVFDFETRKVIDSSTYDSWLPRAPFYHKNLEFNEVYFDRHIFVPVKYKDEWREPFRKKYFSNRKLNVREIVNGIILPMKKIQGKRCGGVCNEDYEFVSGFCNFAHDSDPKNDRCVSSGYMPDKKEIQYVDETVLYGGIHYDHPGHLIIETLANWLWYLVQNQELKIAVIVYDAGFSDISFFREAMEAFGLPQDRIIVVSVPTRFKSIIIPDFSSLMYIYATPYEFTNEWKLFFKHIRDNLVPGEYKKIYLTKTKTSHGNIIGEEFFIDFYKRHGFAILDPENYTIKEKAEFMLGADEVATVIGTNDLFTVFCKPTTTVTLLTRIDDNSYGASAMSMIGESIDCKNIYVVNISAGFLHKQFTMGLAPLYVSNEFKEYARTVFNEEIEIDPEESLKNILIDYMRYIPQHYSIPKYFNRIKNQKMITVLQNISELFLGKDFDVSKLDVSTKESDLQEQLKELNNKNNLLISQVNELSEKNKELMSAKVLKTDNSETKNAQNPNLPDTSPFRGCPDLPAQWESNVILEEKKGNIALKDENDALRRRVRELESINETLIFANTHLSESVKTLSALIKNSNLGEQI